jgi:hypothetical protein
MLLWLEIRSFGQGAGLHGRLLTPFGSGLLYAQKLHYAIMIVYKEVARYRIQKMAHYAVLMQYSKHK